MVLVCGEQQNKTRIFFFFFWSNKLNYFKMPLVLLSHLLHSQPTKKKKQCALLLNPNSLSLSLLLHHQLFSASHRTISKAMAATTTTAASLACAHFLNQNKVYPFPSKTSVQVSQIIDGRKMRSATLFSAASTDKTITTTAQSVSPTACDRFVFFTSSKRLLISLMCRTKNRVF